MIRRVLPGLLLALWAFTAHAHRGGESQLGLTMAADRISGDWEIALNNLAPLFQLGAAADDPASAGALVVAHQVPASRPKSVAFASRIASSSSVNGITASTGPKTSSQASSESRGTGPNIVGAT